jgi:hypothetical protein
MPYRKPPLITPPILTAGQALFLASQQQLHRQSIEETNADAELFAHIMDFDGKFQQNLA